MNRAELNGRERDTVWIQKEISGGMGGTRYLELKSGVERKSASPCHWLHRMRVKSVLGSPSLNYRRRRLTHSCRTVRKYSVSFIRSTDVQCTCMYSASLCIRIGMGGLGIWNCNRALSGKVHPRVTDDTECVLNRYLDHRAWITEREDNTFM